MGCIGGIVFTFVLWSGVLAGCFWMFDSDG